MREMLIKTPSMTLRDLHRDVWRMVHSPKDRGDCNRTFLFRLMDDEGRVLVRGPNLPNVHSRPIQGPVKGRVYVFEATVRAVTRSKYGEKTIRPDKVPAWLGQKLQGCTVLSCDPGRPRGFAINQKVTLSGYDIHGILRIDDAERAATMLAKGIGRSRAYGFGLIVLSAAEAALRAA